MTNGPIGAAMGYGLVHGGMDFAPQATRWMSGKSISFQLIDFETLRLHQWLQRSPARTFKRQATATVMRVLATFDWAASWSHEYSGRNLRRRPSARWADAQNRRLYLQLLSPLTSHPSTVSKQSMPNTMICSIFHRKGYHQTYRNTFPKNGCNVQSKVFLCWSVGGGCVRLRGGCVRLRLRGGCVRLRALATAALGEAYSNSTVSSIRFQDGCNLNHH